MTKAGWKDWSSVPAEAANPWPQLVMAAVTFWVVAGD
jgi:hypothetical protein